MEGDDPARSIGTFSVQVFEGAESSVTPTADHLITETVGDRDGVIEDCWMANLDADENPEVLVFTISAGSGGYANLYVYEFDGAELLATTLPDPDSGLMSGYQGRDWYELVDGILVRRFPLYRNEDANCCPQGGSRVIEFDGAANAWRLSSDDNLGGG